jgi:hypothetical protein
VRSPALLAILVLFVAGSLLVGCSTRRVLTIDSKPQGARIWVNGALQAKRTPVDVPFTHYGRFDVRLEKEGYESVATEIDLPSQIDGLPVIDLFLELVVRERRMRRVIEMRPLAGSPSEADVDAVMQRASAFRARTEREVRGADPPERILP